MDKIYGRKLNKKNISLFYSTILILVKIILVNLENLRLLYNYESEIHMVIEGNGNQNILNKNFQYEPSEIIVNGYVNNSCKKTCFFHDDLNNITIKFSNQIYSSENMFKNLKNILEIDLSNFDTSQITNMNSMFSGCSNLSKVILSNRNTYNLRNMSNMFYSCSNLFTIYFGNIDTSSVENMEHLFHGCFQINSIDLSKFDTSKVTSMFAMFLNCTNLETINFGNINTSSVETMRSMFNKCSKLKSLNLSSFDTSKVTTFEYMFIHCYKLSFIDLSSFNTPNLLNITQMFYNCSNLESINFGNINTSLVKSMNHLFYHCSKLKSLDLSKFDASKVTGMYSMFWNCTNLETINFGNINTSSVETMRSMFNTCSKLESLNLSSFDTSKVTTFQYMFINCRNLKYLDISNFKATNLSNMYSMISNCKSLIYLNFYSFQLFLPINSTKAISGTSENLIFCVKDNYTKNYLFGEDKISICLEPCSNDNYKKINESIDGCVKSCYNYGFEYEYKNICYHECSKNINNENICRKIISSSQNSEILYECIKNNNINDNCNFNNIENETDILNIIQQNIKSLFDSEKGKSQVIKGGNDVIYQITNSKKERELLQNNIINNQNLSIIDLGECENKLKKEYNIHDNESLIYLKKENIKVKTSEKDIQYQIYDPYNFTQLNLSICKEEKINIYMPIILSDDTRNTYENMKSLGYDMFNINDPFYHDLCTPYTTENNTDIPLSARKEYIYNNKDSQCPDNCHFSSYILNSFYINCTCNIEKREEKEVRKFSAKTLYESFYDVLKYANFKILKCYNLIFNINIFRNNIGNYLVISMFSFKLICLFLFIAKGIAPLKEKIKNLISNPNEEINNRNNIDIYNIIFKKDFRNKKVRKNKILSNPKKKKKYKNSKTCQNKKLKNKLEKNINNYSISSKKFISNSSIRENKNKFDNLNLQKDKTKLEIFEMNQLEYEDAINYDKRSFIRIYWDLLCREHLIIFTFFICNDYNILYIKYARFIFLIATDMAINIFFFSDDSMHKIYLNYGKYNFIQQIPQIVYTTIISQLIEIFLCYLSLTDKHIYQIMDLAPTIKKKEIITILKCIKIKLVLFFIFTFLFITFYWYTITSFCAVYENTQITFIKDSLLSFLLSILYPFIIYLIPSALRIISLRNKEINLKCVYKLSEIIPFF